MVSGLTLPGGVPKLSLAQTVWDIPRACLTNLAFPFYKARRVLSPLSLNFHTVLQHAGRHTDETMLAQVVQDETGILFRCMRHCIQRDFRLSWGLVGIVNPRKIFNFSTASLGIHTLRVACLTYLQ